MSRWYELHIKNEILFWFLIVSIAPIITLFSVNYFLQQNQFKVQTQEHLELILNEKISKIENSIESFEQEVKLIATIPSVAQSFKISQENFAKRSTPAPNKNLDTMLESFLNKNRFYDIFFINLNGDIIYSLKKESDLGTNLKNGMYKDSNLAWVFKNAKMFLETQISKFEFYLPSNTHAAFIAHPIYQDDQILGIVAVQLSQEKLFEIFSDQQGLGNSGELFAVYKNEQNKILSVTPLKHIHNSVVNEYQFPNHEYLSSTKAISGMQGKGPTKDYRGIEVIAAWNYIPALGWGVVAKIDSDEVLKPISDLEFYSIIVIFFVILAIVVAIMMATKHIVTPIDELTQKVKRFSNGNLENIKSIDSCSLVDNEIGTLARNFNEMALNLKSSQETIKKYANELEDKVKLRTKELEDAKDELSITNASMKRYLGIIDKYVITSSTDLSGTITEVSTAFCKITGYSKEELIGKKHNMIRHPNMPSGIYEQMWETIKNGQIWSGEIQNLKKDGSSYWVYSTISPTYDSLEKKIGYTSVRQDITYQKLVEELSIKDRLTGLYNRLKLESVFEYEIDRAKRYGEFFSILIVDIDHFKSVNDNYGHDVGDDTLIDFARILKQNSRSTDIVGRWGGEEFLLILPQTDLSSAEKLAQKLRLKVEEFNFKVVEHCTASFGVSTYTNEDNSFESIVKRADNALYEAKRNGRNQVCVE